MQSHVSLYLPVCLAKCLFFLLVCNKSKMLACIVYMHACLRASFTGVSIDRWVHVLMFQRRGSMHVLVFVCVVWKYALLVMPYCHESAWMMTCMMSAWSFIWARVCAICARTCVHTYMCAVFKALHKYCNMPMSEKGWVYACINTYIHACMHIHTHMSDTWTFQTNVCVGHTHIHTYKHSYAHAHPR
jgi:hypothetical protein